jgi:hypothetical protein
MREIELPSLTDAEAAARLELFEKQFAELVRPAPLNGG